MYNQKKGLPLYRQHDKRSSLTYPLAIFIYIQEAFINKYIYIVDITDIAGYINWIAIKLIQWQYNHLK